MVYDQNKHSFEHIDCAVRIFNKNTYDNIYADLLSGKMPDRQIGTRFKLLKISGNINFDHKPIPVSMSLHFVVSKVVQYIKGELAERCKGNFENIDTLYEGVPARISSKYAGG